MINTMTGRQREDRISRTQPLPAAQPDRRHICKTPLYLLDFKPLLCVSWRHVEQLHIYTTKTATKEKTTNARH